MAKAKISDADELIIAQKELALQKGEKEKLEAALKIANKELSLITFIIHIRFR